MADDAEVRKLVKSVNRVEDRLSVITAVKSMRHLVPAFKVSSKVKGQFSRSGSVLKVKDRAPRYLLRSLQQNMGLKVKNVRNASVCVSLDRFTK